MRTGKIELRSILHSQKIVEIERREGRHTLQTVLHIPMECRKFSRLRQETWKEEQHKERFRVAEWNKILTRSLYVHKEIYRVYAKDTLAKAVLQYQGVGWE